jgi:2-dehydro-3-deoxyphosphooctonate aldolase (KDO 8-P synthase)
MKQFGYPIVFDSTHSVQLPGGMGIKSGGAREYVVPLSKSAASLRLAGFFIETHPNPEKALSDGPNMMHLHNMPKLLNSINKINKAAK